MSFLFSNLFIPSLFYCRPNRPNRPGAANRDLEEDEFWIQFEDEDRLLRRLQKRNTCTTSNLLLDLPFNTAVKRLTAFTEAENSRSVLNQTRTGDVAVCANNWDVVNAGGVSTLTCDEFEACDNGDLVYSEDAVACLEPSSMPSESPSPTPAPTGYDDDETSDSSD